MLLRWLERVKGDDHNCTRMGFLSDRIFLHDPCSRSIRFVLGWSFGTTKRAEEAAIIFDRWVDGPRNAMWIKSVCTGFIKLLVAGVVHDESIACERTTDRNAIHIICLVLGPDDVAILLMVEVAHRKEREPHMSVGLGAMNKYEGRCKFTTELSWNHVRHLHNVMNIIEPEVAGQLLFGGIDMGHVDHGFPMTINETIRRLTSNSSSYNIGLVLNKM